MNFKLNMLFFLCLSSLSINAMDNQPIQIKNPQSLSVNTEELAILKDINLGYLKLKNFAPNNPKYTFLFLYGLLRLKTFSNSKLCLAITLLTQIYLSKNMYNSEHDTTWLGAVGYFILL